MCDTALLTGVQVFNCLLSMRADKTGQVGFYDDNLSDLKYSPFHICTPDGGQRSMPFSRTILHLGGVFEAVRACLSKVYMMCVVCGIYVVCRIWSGKQCFSCYTS